MLLTYQIPDGLLKRCNKCACIQVNGMADD